MYKCATCGLTKASSEFGARRGVKGGRRTVCKACVASHERERQRKQATPAADRLKGMLPFGTPMQRATAESVLRCGSVVAAAEELQLTARALHGHLHELERAAAKRGWLPGDGPVETTPEGFSIRGTSTYYDGDGNVVGRWVKTKADEEGKLVTLANAIQALAEPFKGSAEPIPAPQNSNADLLCVYPMGDPHLGMLAWAQETGADFDLAIAERNLVAAVDRLVALAPPAEEALIIDVGDFFHTDNTTNKTLRSGHALDVDSRWAKILAVGIRAMRRTIDRALEKHARVRVIIEIGNHDDHSAIMLALCLAAYYEREPRVTVDTSPDKFHWYRFGLNLIGVTHGDTVKADKLAGVMSVDQAVAWGETRYRYWYTGHVHHESVKEYPGCTVETFRTLASRDTWHHASGYRSDRDMRLDILHRKYGRIGRHIVGIDQITEKDQP